MRSPAVWVVLVALVALPVRADDLSSYSTPAPVASSFFPGAGSYQVPRPGSLLPSSLFDPSRFSIHNSIQYGFSSGGPYQGSAGLFTSSLGYLVRSNMRLSVDVGAHMNPAFGSSEIQKGIFVQGAAFDWQPSRNSLVRIEYRDVRSPLQNRFAGPGYGNAYSPYGYGYGANSGYGYYGFGDPGLGQWTPGGFSTAPPPWDARRN